MNVTNDAEGVVLALNNPLWNLHKKRHLQTSLGRSPRAAAPLAVAPTPADSPTTGPTDPCGSSAGSTRTPCANGKTLGQHPPRAATAQQIQQRVNHQAAIHWRSPASLRSGQERFDLSPLRFGQISQVALPRPKAGICPNKTGSCTTVVTAVPLSVALPAAPILTCYAPAARIICQMLRVMDNGGKRFALMGSVEQERQGVTSLGA